MTDDLARHKPSACPNTTCLAEVGSHTWRHCVRRPCWTPRTPGLATSETIAREQKRVQDRRSK